MRVQILFLLAVTFLNACNQSDKKKSKQQNDKSEIIIDKIVDTPNIDAQKKRDSALMNISIEILQSIKSRDYEKLASFASPGGGIRFSPYGFVNINTSQVLFPSQLAEYVKSKKVLNWGTSDGSGDDIKMTVPAYFEKFVYAKDFLNADKRSVNKFLGEGNSLNNLNKIFPGADFTEFYFPGFDPKYEGMDWQTLRLIFNLENQRYVLIGIVHDEWTI